MQDWLSLSAGQLGRMIGTGEIGPVELTKAYLSAIHSHPFADRIYARITSDRALAEAQAAEKRALSANRLSPLDGVPVSWKDLFDTKDVLTEAGTELLKGRVPATDAVVLQNATQAGLVCLGKTHMTELAFSGLGYNPVTQSPPCVNDHDAASGGSSSGAATSVAFGLAAAAIGSDTGGSVRIPAAWNDLVGLKTTSGRLSLDGVVPLCARFDTVGPLCRTVEDAKLVFEALAGEKLPDVPDRKLSDMRFAVLETIALDSVDAPHLAGFESAVARLRDAGAAIETIDVPAVNDAMDLAALVVAPEAYGTWGAAIEANPEKMFAGVRERFRTGRAVLAADYVAAWQKLDQIRKTYLTATQAYDAVLLPTTPNTPPKLQELAADGELFLQDNLRALRNTRIGNLLGLSALTLPTGVPSVGILLQAPPNAEAELLQIGAVAENALT